MSNHWPLPDIFRIRVTMESDWHVGSGLGRPGNIDRLIVRDADGLPFVPAKTLRGIWRDSCERLCRGLDGRQLGEWSRYVDRLFGSQPGLAKRREEESRDPTKYHDDPWNEPIESAVQIRAALVADSLRELLKPLCERQDDEQSKRQQQQRKLLREAMTFIKPGVKIDRRSGSAQTDYLRFEELARKGTILEAECRLREDLEQEAREAASALLIASAKLVERLGGKRRRGAGRCCLEILDADTDSAIAWLEQMMSPPTWSSARETSATRGDLRVATNDDPWISVPLLLKLQGPLAVSYRTTGNVVETLDFLPGSYLLPHMTRVFPELRAAIPSGDVIVLPAYPEMDGERSLPVPLALFAPKGGKGLEERDKLVNRLLQPEPTDGTQLKPMRGGYFSTRARKVFNTPITVRTHNTIEDQPQRPTRDVGGVYTYEAIAPVDSGNPMRLGSELRLRQSLADRLAASQPEWWTKLDGNVSLGRSKKDDYGSVELQTAPATKWISDVKTDGDELFVWLMSDTLIHNDQLRPEPTAKALADELGRRLEVNLTIRENVGSDLLDERIRIRRLETWHVGWGLPRPSLVALQAGSCMVFHAEGTIAPEALAQLEAGGIGERTAEGYGQVRFNHPLLTRAPSEWPTSGPASESDSTMSAAKPLPSSDPAFAFARLLEHECWKQEIRRKCLEIAGNSDERKNLLGWESKGEQGSPPMSQLGGLREQLALLRSVADRQRILDWLDQLTANNGRKGKWPSIPKVKAFVETETRIWQIIDTTNWPALTEAAATQLHQKLWPLAVRTFFDACIRAHKRELEKAHLKEVPSGA